MRIIPRHIKGHGIHSPFVYNLVTKVIDERSAYYRLDDIELIRKQLYFKDISKREVIRPKYGALLFRLTNYFHPKNILEIGGGAGLSTLYLTSYASAIRCISLEETTKYTPVARWVYNKAARTAIDSRIGAFKETLPPALEDIKNLDFVFFNLLDEQTDYLWLFINCIKYIHTDTVFVLEGIKSNRRMRECWKQIHTHPDVTVAIDLGSMGIVFFNKKLHKRTYPVYF